MKSAKLNQLSWGCDEKVSWKMEEKGLMAIF
jgi:hypothetical protein